MATPRTSDVELKDLTDTLARIDDASLMADVVDAILTPTERRRLSLRWELVKLLEQGISQRKICEQLGVSLCKVTRGSRELKHGRAGFREVVREALRRRAEARRPAADRG